MKNTASLKNSHYFLIVKIMCAFLVGAGSMYLFVSPHLQKPPVQSDSVVMKQQDTNVAQKEISNTIGLNTEIKKSDSWATYTDSNKTFSFSYPPDWHITSHEDIVELISPHNITKTSTLSVTLLIDQSQQQIKEWLKGKIIGGQCCSDEFTLESFIQNGHTFYAVTQEKSPYVGIITNQNGVMYYFYPLLGGLEGGTTDQENNPLLLQDLETYKKITTTFSFL